MGINMDQVRFPDRDRKRIKKDEKYTFGWPTMF
jgi:hypothetical protein